MGKIKSSNAIFTLEFDFIVVLLKVVLVVGTFVTLMVDAAEPFVELAPYVAVVSVKMKVLLEVKIVVSASRSL